MNSEELDKDLALNIAYSIHNEGWDLEKYMQIVCGNEYLHTDTIAYIRRHAEEAMRIIRLTQRKNERKAKEEKSDQASS